jgi:hypothetical protein
VVAFDDLRLFKRAASWYPNAMLISDREIAFPSIQGSDFNPHFRKGFWRQTARRFWALLAIQRQLQKPIIHFESDVLVMKRFPFEKFLELPRPIAFPMSAPGYGVASVFYSYDEKHLAELLSLWESGRVVEVGDRQHPPNDMTRLGAAATQTDLVSVLPTCPPAQSREFQKESRGTDFLSQNYERFSGVFDAATLGQYLFGMDARNARGFRRVYSRRPYHTIRPQEFIFTQGEPGTVCMKSKVTGETSEVFNFHIHSKDLRVFSSPFGEAMVSRRIRNSQERQTKVEIDPWAFSVSFVDRLQRLIRKEDCGVNTDPSSASQDPK